MTTHDEAFLEAIREHPNDDAPRLIYADWLEEHGGRAGAARAEFIRIQCERERVPFRSPRWYALDSHASALQEEYESDWLGPHGKRLQNYCFRRGFLDYIRLTAGQFLDNAEELFRLGPIRAVLLSETRDVTHALASFSPLSQVSLLALMGNDLCCEDLRVLCGSPHLNHLTGLDLFHNHLDTEAIRVLRQAPFFPRLDSLSLGSNIGATAVEYLVDVPESVQLKKLDLKFNTLGAAGVQALTSNRAFYCGLTHLNLSRCDISTAGARALAHAGGQLKELQLNNNPIGDDGVQELAESPALASLTTLRLRRTGLGSVVGTALASSRFLRGLTTLSLANNRLGYLGARELASSQGLSQLTFLNLEGNEIGDEGVRALVSSPQLANLKSLFLGVNGLRPWGLRELIMSQNLANLHVLDLHGNNLQDQGAQVIARWCRLPQLTNLALNSNRIGDLGVQELAASPHLPSLRILDLSSNDFSDDAEATLKRSSLQQQLLSLKLFEDPMLSRRIYPYL